MPKGVQVQVLLTAPTTYDGPTGYGTHHYAKLPSLSPNLLPNPWAKRHLRYARIARGLFRDSRTGNLWHVAKKERRV